MRSLSLQKQKKTDLWSMYARINRGLPNLATGHCLKLAQHTLVLDNSLTSWKCFSASEPPPPQVMVNAVRIHTDNVLWIRNASSFRVSKCDALLSLEANCWGCWIFLVICSFYRSSVLAVSTTSSLCALGLHGSYVTQSQHTCP